MLSRAVKGRAGLLNSSHIVVVHVVGCGSGSGSGLCGGSVLW